MRRRSSLALGVALLLAALPAATTDVYDAARTATTNTVVN
jgi:hypothetical protein